jgi:putative endopeptidase
MSALTLNRRTLFLTGAAAAGLAACGKFAPAKPVYGTFGFDTAGMDKTVSPGDDFFAYANGNWVKTTEIPADRSSYNTFTILTEKAEARTRAIVEEMAAKSGSAGDERKIGDFYTAFMDEAGIEQRGIAPLKPELDAIAAIADKPALSRYLGTTLRADVDLLNATNYYTDRLFGVWVSQDMDTPTQNSPYLVQGGLGLPDRSFYLDAENAETRASYKAHLAKILGLAAIADPDAKAGRILALETAIARVHATQEETNDVAKGNNRWTRADFAAKAPGIDWTGYFDSAGLGGQQTFVVWQPAALAGIAALVGTASLEDWKDYLTSRSIDRSSGVLPKAFADENFAFYGTSLNGTPEQQPRWKRAVNAVNAALGEAIGKIYVQRHFPASSKARAEEMVKNIVAAFGKRIDALAWMTPETKARAHAKLKTLTVAVGYPKAFRDYAAYDVRRDDALGNFQRSSLFEYRRNIAKLGKPVNHDEWYLLPQQVNALNVPLENGLQFPAAILEAPFFDPAADDAVNYGGIGGVIGHEITHSFDSTGALFDEAGKLDNWWQPADLTRFNASGDALVAQYDAYMAFPDLHLNGRLELGENIADVAGLATSYDAWKLTLGGKPAPVLEGFTGDQRFFLGWAQNYRSKYREKSLRNRVLTDVHAPGPWRAATVRNQDPWYPAFDVKPGQALYLAPDKRVKVW